MRLGKSKKHAEHENLQRKFNAPEVSMPLSGAHALTEMLKVFQGE